MEKQNNNSVRNVTFSDNIQVHYIYQHENENRISKRDFYYAKCKLQYFFETKLKRKTKCGTIT